MYYIKLFLLYISEIYNKIICKKKTYKFLTYVDKEGEKDKLIDAFEIKEYSERRAFKVAYKMLKMKYPGSGLDLRLV